MTFLRRQGVGGNTYNAGESASFPRPICEKLIRLKLAKPYEDLLAKEDRTTKVSAPVRKA
ncbi:hypothetical protein GMO_11550 [Gluconobacter morbifer G707]|uniref:Uncharacterized protein n=1 Tax=Gluconobacter morbifer G707 TaxID=1088869 RepID=G6XIS7_9PROT|nr:hypothetical protein GMO_11550 [Gluconobacter morbifer G707]